MSLEFYRHKLLKRASNSRNVCIRIMQTQNDFDPAESDPDLPDKMCINGIMHPNAA